MKHLSYTVGVALMLGAGMQPVVARASAELIVNNVVRKVRNLDCPGAVEALNDGLKEHYGEVSLLAGTMFEEGICVKPSWERAATFYLQADADGQPAAAYRLAAGYASPAGGRDVATALWWAGKRLPRMVAACMVPEADRASPERFVAVLNTWTRERLEGCNYAVGVMSMVAGEAQFPSIARGYAVQGAVVIHFIPAGPRIDLKPIAGDELQMRGVVSSYALRDRKNKDVTGSFEANVRAVSDRALKRFPQPAGIDPMWSADLTINYKLIER